MVAFQISPQKINLHIFEKNYKGLPRSLNGSFSLMSDACTDVYPICTNTCGWSVGMILFFHFILIQYYIWLGGCHKPVRMTEIKRNMKFLFSHSWGKMRADKQLCVFADMWKHEGQRQFCFDGCKEKQRNANDVMCVGELDTYLRCDKNFPVEWPEPSQPGIGHLQNTHIFKRN